MTERLEDLKAYLSRLWGKDAAFMGLRWLALLLVLVLSLFNPFTVGVLLPISTVFPVVVIYNLLMEGLGRLSAWARRPLNLLALDTLVAAVAVYLTGGFHSSFFITFYFIVAGAAFYLNLVQTVVVALLLQVTYVAICLLNPGSRQFPYTIYSVAAKSALLPLVALLCALLLEQLHREHHETEREKALRSRLITLNDIFQQLSTSLDMGHVLQTVVTASRRILEADVVLVSLMDEGECRLRPVAAHGIDNPSIADVRWPMEDKPVAIPPCKAAETPKISEVRWLMEDKRVATMVETGQPGVFAQSSPYPGQYGPLLTILEREGIICGTSVPLVLNERPIGVLYMGYRRACHHSLEDLPFLTALGREVAIAVRNAHLYQAEKRQVEQLQMLEQLQASFVSSVSHELRTPLTILRTSLALLREQGQALSDEARQELLETSQHHAGRLEGLVTDLLQVTRLEAGQVTLSRQPTDLRTIVERAVQAFIPLVEARQQTITLDLPSCLSPVSVDRRRIEQVLNNLLSNAHKFTPEGGHIRVGVQEQKEFVEVRIQDDGPGIPLQEQERIFEKFYTLDTHRGRAGVGLGLYIARQLVDLHGGSIGVKSQPGAGSAFYFTIPKEKEL